MLEGLKDALDALLNHGKALADAEANVVELADGRRFTRKSLVEIKPDEPDVQLDAIGSVADFADVLERYAPEYPEAIVLVTVQGARAHLRPICRDHQERRFDLHPYTAVLPPTEGLGYVPFMELLDAYAGKLEEADEIRTACKVMRAVGVKAIKFEDRGAITHVTFEASNGVETPGLDVPKVVHFNVAYGDPTYTMRLAYRLRVTAAGDGLMFQLSPMPFVDMRHENYVTKAIEDLRKALGDKVRVYRGA